MQGKSETTANLFRPECAGASRKWHEKCPRCGAGRRDDCWDDAAFNAQLAQRTEAALATQHQTTEDVVPVPRETWNALQVRAYEMAERLDNAERRLRELGYRRCTSPACNCKGYHRDV